MLVGEVSKFFKEASEEVARIMHKVTEQKENLSTINYHSMIFYKTNGSVASAHGDVWWWIYNDVRWVLKLSNITCWITQNVSDRPSSDSYRHNTKRKYNKFVEYKMKNIYKQGNRNYVVHFHRLCCFVINELSSKFFNLQLTFDQKLEKKTVMTIILKNNYIHTCTCK